MRAIILGKVPNANASSAITSNDFSLVGMNDYIIDWRAMGIASLNRATPSLPDLDSAILRACDHPFPFAVKCDTRDIASMTFESEERVRIGGLDVVELDSVVASGSEEAFVWRDAETVDLRVRVLDCARANTREGLPETERIIVLGRLPTASGSGHTE
jgi:hypothetical protein